MRDKKGFTLLEISIVLVIIGLIVGGILAGRELISAAEIRAQISQLEKYNAAVNAFRMKYGFLPGDMPSQASAQLGFFAVTGGLANTPGFGDGNGLIQGAGGSWEANGEILAFWRHLTDAQMIDGAFGTASSGSALAPATGALPDDLTTGDVSQALPEAKLGRGSFLAAFAVTNANYYRIGGMSALNADGTYMGQSSITPSEAFQIDVKLDDGKPLLGKLHLMSGMGWELAGPMGFAGCITLFSMTEYAIAGSNGDTPYCVLYVRTTF